MTYTNQKLREALQSISDIDDSTNHAVDASAALDRIGQIAREALALPTAAPVGERELFEREAVRSGYSVDKYAGTSIYADISTARAYEWWQSGRATLSAGDAVDEQRYRWLMDNCTLGIKQNGVGWSLNTTDCIAPDCIKDVGATIDAAMRKAQL